MPNNKKNPFIPNKAFASKFTDPVVVTFPNASDYPLDPLLHLNVTEQSARAAISSISPKKACGSDNVSAGIILNVVRRGYYHP